MIEHFAAWTANTRDIYEKEGNQGNQGNHAEITGAFLVTHSENKRVTRVTELPKLPNENQKGQQNITNEFNEITQVTQVTQNNVATSPVILAATEADATELNSWPPETQRVYVRVLDYLEAQGHPLVEAEPLALEVVRLLMKRQRGPIALVSDLPPEVAQAVGLALDVLGPSHVTWRPKRREVL